MYVECCSVWQQREPVNICFDWVCCYALMLSSFEEDSSCSSSSWQAVTNHFMYGVTLVTPYCDWIIFLTFSNFMCKHNFMPLRSVDTKCLNSFTTIWGAIFFPTVLLKPKRSKAFPGKHRRRFGQNFTCGNWTNGASEKTRKKHNFFLHQSSNRSATITICWKWQKTQNPSICSFSSRLCTAVAYKQCLAHINSKKCKASIHEG